jgi:hypothetical protein
MKTLFSKKDEEEWGREVWGKPREKCEQERHGLKS